MANYPTNQRVATESQPHKAGSAVAFVAPTISKEIDFLTSTSGIPTPTAPLRPLWLNRDYMLLWSGQTISSIGGGVSGIALPLLLLAITHDPSVAGFAGAIRSLPYVFLSLPAGALVDRWNRKYVMIACDTGRTIALGSIALALWFGSLTIVQIYLVALVEGTLFVFFNIAEAACLPQVVAKSQLPAATGQNQATESISILVSQPIGGALYGFSLIVPFVVDAVSYFVSLISLAFIRVPFQAPRQTSDHHLLAEITEGVRWLWQQRLIRYIAILTGVINFVFSGSFLIIIVLAQGLHATPLFIGILGSIAAVGGIVGAALGAVIQKRFSFGTVIIGTLLVQTIAWFTQIIAPNLYVLGIINSVIFLVVPIYNVTQLSYRAALIPDRLQGRVTSAVRLIAFGFIPVGLAVTGVLLRQFGPRITLGVFGIVLTIALIVTALNPLVRTARPIAQATAEDGMQ